MSQDSFEICVRNVTLLCKMNKQESYRGFPQDQGTCIDLGLALWETLKFILLRGEGDLDFSFYLIIEFSAPKYPPNILYKKSVDRKCY